MSEKLVCEACNKEVKGLQQVSNVWNADNKRIMACQKCFGKYRRTTRKLQKHLKSLLGC